MNKNKIFADFCNVYGKFAKPKSDRVTLVEKYNTGFTGNLFDIYNEIRSRYPETKFNIIRHDDYSGGIKGIFKLISLFTVKAWRFMSSGYIFLNDNFMPMAYIRFPENVKIIQVWHGIGAFKLFGIPTLKDPQLVQEVKDINKNVDLFPVTTEKAIPVFAEAFGVPESKVQVIGVPQADYYLRKHDIKALREAFDRQYPECRGKKLVLYAPTFRDHKEADKALLSNFDFQKFNESLSDEYRLLLRLHPQVHSGNTELADVTNVTDYPSIRTLLLISDIMIADYSSVTIEFSLLNKPIIMYPFDYEEFCSHDRGFYFDYFKQAPGPICYTTDEVIDCIRNKRFLPEKVKAYAELHNDIFDGDSVKRIVDYAYNTEKNKRE